MAKTLVTGASKGIGRSIAERFAQAGRDVIGTYNSGKEDVPELLQAGVKQMIPLDLTDRKGAARALAELKDEQFDVIVNNAGIVDFRKWPSADMGSWDRVFDVNVRGPFLVVATLEASIMDGASIVNIASTDGDTGSFASISYSASKAALKNLSKSLANVLGSRGIRVNTVSPGWIDTGMSTEESYEAAALTPLGRNGSPREVADLVEFLCSPSAAYITGADLVIDGGYTGVDSIMKKENDGL